MNLRWLNSFTILAIILVVVAILGLILQGKMVFDPGRPPSGWEWLLYLLAGGLMLVNSALTVQASREEEINSKKE